MGEVLVGSIPLLVVDILLLGGEVLGEGYLRRPVSSYL